MCSIILGLEGTEERGSCRTDYYNVGFRFLGEFLDLYTGNCNSSAILSVRVSAHVAFCPLPRYLSAGLVLIVAPAWRGGDGEGRDQCATYILKTPYLALRGLLLGVPADSRGKGCRGVSRGRGREPDSSRRGAAEEEGPGASHAGPVGAQAQGVCSGLQGPRGCHLYRMDQTSAEHR